MKKTVLAALIFALLATPVFAEDSFSGFSYTSDENHTCKMADGYEYIGYFGEFKFNASFDSKPDEIGCVLQKTTDSEGSYDPIYLRSIYFGDSYGIKFSGRGLSSGKYTLKPYTRKGTSYTYGSETPFTITETCEIMTNLRIVYDKIGKIQFNKKQKDFVDLIMPAISETITAGENGTEITDTYIRNTHSEIVKDVEEMSKNFNNSERTEFLYKFDSVGRIAILRILDLFGISF